MNWSDNKTFIVYKYTLKGTDKVYIGQTCMTIAQRAGYHWQYLEKDKIKGENNNE